MEVASGAHCSYADRHTQWNKDQRKEPHETQAQAEETPTPAEVELDDGEIRLASDRTRDRAAGPEAGGGGVMLKAPLKPSPMSSIDILGADGRWVACAREADCDHIILCVNAVHEHCADNPSRIAQFVEVAKRHAKTLEQVRKECE